jgi:cupin 2 domain-containing protein
MDVRHAILLVAEFDWHRSRRPEAARRPRRPDEEGLGHVGGTAFMIIPTNVFDDLPPTLPDELFTTLLESANVRIERIVSQGHSSPEGFWYDQDQHEWVILLKGAARLRFEDETVEMKSGHFINIPAHKKHRVEWTTPDEPTIWLAVRYEPR